MARSTDTVTSSKPTAVVVGTSFGLRIHVPALRAAGFEVSGLVGTDPTRTRRRADRLGVAGAWSSLAQALDTAPALVTIATPPATHAKLAIEALSAGVPVLCEKPQALTLEEGRAIARAAASSSSGAWVGFEFRFTDSASALAAAIERRAVGRPRFAVAEDALPLLTDARKPGIRPWQLNSEQGGGWLTGTGPHLLDQVLQLTGPIVRVSAGTAIVADRERGAEDSYAARFVGIDGVEGLFWSSGATFAPPLRSVRVLGTEGTVWSDHSGAWVAAADGHQRLDPPPGLANPEPEARGAQAHVALPYARLFERLREELEAAPATATVPRLPTFEDGLAAMEVDAAIRDSAAREGEWADVPTGTVA